MRVNTISSTALENNYRQNSAQKNQFKQSQGFGAIVKTGEVRHLIRNEDLPVVDHLVDEIRSLGVDYLIKFRKPDINAVEPFQTDIYQIKLTNQKNGSQNPVGAFLCNIVDKFGIIKKPEPEYKVGQLVHTIVDNTPQYTGEHHLPEHIRLVQRFLTKNFLPEQERLAAEKAARANIAQAVLRPQQALVIPE